MAHTAGEAPPGCRSTAAAAAAFGPGAPSRELPINATGQSLAAIGYRRGWWQCPPGQRLQSDHKQTQREGHATARWNAGCGCGMCCFPFTQPHCACHAPAADLVLAPNPGSSSCIAWPACITAVHAVVLHVPD